LVFWLDRAIRKWDSEKQQWERYFYELEDKDYENAKQENIKSPINKNEKDGQHIVLKSLNNSSNINEDFLNEVNNLYMTKLFIHKYKLTYMFIFVNLVEKLFKVYIFI